MTFILILLGSIENGKLLSRRNVDGFGTNLVHHFIDQSNVGESTSSHDFIVTSSSTIGVEVLLLDISFIEISSSRRVLSNRTSRRDVISSNGVT